MGIAIVSNSDVYKIRPAWVTLALFLSCVRINLLRTRCAELNGSTADGRVMNVPALAAAVLPRAPPAHVTAIGERRILGTFAPPRFACRAPG